MNQLRVFTVQEANQIIPQLNLLLKKLQAKKREILGREIEIDALELVTSDGGRNNPQIQKSLEDYEAAVNEFYSIVDEIHQTGCFLKDVDSGLVDFYTVYQGRVVYLCWRQGEEAITCWHEIGRGFPHRQPLEADIEL